MGRANKGHGGGIVGSLLLLAMVISLSSCRSGNANSSDSITTTAGNETGTTSISNMNLGEVKFLDFGSGQTAKVNFDADSSQATYLALVQSNNIREGNVTLTLQADQNSAPVASGSPDGSDVGSDETQLALNSAFMDEEFDDNPMHEMMRAWESYYVDSPDFDVVTPLQASLSAIQLAAAAAPTKTFRVLDSLSSVSSYAEVEGRLRYSTDEILIYVDTEMDGDSALSDSDIRLLAGSFSDHSMPLARNLFGSESDINSDGRVTILMTPILNRICSGTGIVTGFFFPGDMFARTSGNPASNEQEIFYTMVPDPRGEFCSPVGVDFTINNILHGVLVHEFQHMISFNQHVLLNGGTTEEPWLNEALSHLVEDVAGYGLENYSRMNLFLNAASQTTLIPNGLPSLSERGMGFMFMRYLYEQADDPVDFLNALLNTNLTGVENIESAFDGLDGDFDDFTEFFANWQVALVLTGTGITEDERYIYQDRVTNAFTGNVSGICLHCDANDGRGTKLAGPLLTPVNSFPSSVTMESTSGQYFELVEPGDTLTVSGSAGAELGGALIRLEDK